MIKGPTRRTTRVAGVTCAPRTFDELVTEGWTHPTHGWDFSWLGDRIREDPLPWDYTATVLRFARTSPSLVDLGTGGGEWLASLPFRPAHTVATEAWPPNVDVARNRLLPLGVEVMAYEAPADNLHLGADPPLLPFADSSLHLITNRHESFVPDELARVLGAGGHFITQQVGDSDGLAALLGLPQLQDDHPRWRLALAVAQLESAGFRIVQRGQARPITRFADVGALVWFLKMAPWAVPEFNPDRFHKTLAKLHRRSTQAPIALREVRFWVLAQR